jgi:hypothetical protein
MGAGEWIAISIGVIAVFGLFLNLSRLNLQQKKNEERFLSKKEHDKYCRQDEFREYIDSASSSLTEMKVKMGRMDENIKMLMRQRGLTPISGNPEKKGGET